MFGFFNKPDTRATTDQSILYLNSLPPKEKAVVIEKIERFLNMIVSHELLQKDAFTAVMQAKQSCMYRHKLQDHRHPEFSMFQLLEDAYLSIYSHAKLQSKKYSAVKFADFMISNSKDHRRTTILLSGSGFDPIDLF